MRAEATALLRRGEYVSPLAQERGEVQPPIPIVAPDGQPHSWFVGIVVGDVLVGYFQFGLEAEFLRYSTFQRDPGSTKGCPPRGSWLVPEQVLACARRVVAGKPVEAPVLTYDRNPSRIVWRVGIRGAEGKEHLVYVAGGYAYSAET